MKQVLVNEEIMIISWLFQEKERFLLLHPDFHLLTLAVGPNISSDVLQTSILEDFRKLGYLLISWVTMGSTLCCGFLEGDKRA